MDETELVNKIEARCHDGPFGPVEFGCTICKGKDDLPILSVYHMKVHDEYQGHGYGRKTLSKAIRVALEYDIQKVEIAIGGGEDSKRFLQKVGFRDVRVNSEDGVRASQSIQEVQRNL